MKKIFLILVSVFAFSIIFKACSSADKKPSQNSFDKKEKETSFVKLEEVKIGNQIWSAKNYDVDKFLNGDAIPEAKTNDEWKKAIETGQPAWCYYDNKPENGVQYGKLYNWYAVNDPRGLAPKGWKIPSDEDWETLYTFLGGNIVAGGKIKSTTLWENTFNGESGNGSNESGFSGLPSGYRKSNGTFMGMGSESFWWTSTVKNDQLVMTKNLVRNNNRAFKMEISKDNGFPVRLIKLN